MISVTRKPQLLGFFVGFFHFLMVLAQLEQRKCWFYEEISKITQFEQMKRWFYEKISKITYHGFTGE